MRLLKKNYVAWFAFVLALGAWGAVGYVAWSLAGAEVVRMSEAASLEEGTDQLEEALRLHVLARDTKDARAELESLVNADAISIVETIEAIGRDADVDIEIGQVLAVPSAPNASSDAAAVRTLGIAVEVLGGFTEVMHAAALLHTVPISSTIEQLQFERLPAEERTSRREWRLIGNMKVFTTADISS